MLLLTLLLLFCGCLLWPVPPTGSDRVAQNGRTGPRSGLVMEVVDVRVADVSVGTKGYAVVVELRIGTRGGAERQLDLNHFALEIDDVSLPPIPVTEPGGRLHVVPASVSAGEFVDAAVVFAVPYGASDAKLVVNAPDVPADRAVALDVVLPAQEPR